MLETLAIAAFALAVAAGFFACAYMAWPSYWGATIVASLFGIAFVFTGLHAFTSEF